MEYRFLGNTGVQVSELCLGIITFGREADEATSLAMVDRFLEVGGNFVDTADAYGRTAGLTETIVGRALKGKRDKVILATKVFFPTGSGPNERGLSHIHIMHAVEATLRCLQSDYVDLYYLHCRDRRTPLEETLATLDGLVRSGKVRYLGVSNFTAWQIMKAVSISERWGDPSLSACSPSIVW